MTAVVEAPLPESLLRSAAEHSLQVHLEHNAVFLAEQLNILYPSHHSAHLLATAHLRAGNLSRAADILHPAQTPENRYLYAVCLSRIGTPDALRDAEAHLRGIHGPIDAARSGSNSANMPGAAAGLHLLGTICMRTGRRDEAISLYRRAVKLNPTLWVSFEALAKMGIVTKAEQFIGTMDDATAMKKLEAQPHFSVEKRRKEAPSSGLTTGNVSNGHTRTPGEGLGGVFATPSPGRVLPFCGEMRTPAAPLQLMRGRRGVRHLSPLHNAVRRGARDSHVRNPNELFATPTSGAEPGMEVVDVKTGDRSAKRKGAAEEDVKMLGAMDVIRSLGQIAAEMGRYRCTMTVDLAEKLPSALRNSGWVYAIRGRAFLEKGDYAQAETEYLNALRVDPTRMDGVVEYYSTVLWHMRREKELAQLALQAQRVFPVSSGAWCAAGNCFSLQRDPDLALKFFRRAVAASRAPDAYPYTLLGHEHVVKEQFEDALNAYRQALNIDERHYNALYGIGQVLLKQEKFGSAQYHFRSAVYIHPLNSNLHYHLGVALTAAVNANGGIEHLSEAARHELIPALAEFETAANLDVTNPVPRFERAKVLVALNRLPEAKRQLEKLRDSLPREAAVHYELSCVCQRTGDIKGALRELTIALDLEPKERKYKKALETLSNSLDPEL
eukprot:GFKZ01006514.1.p1 GENE.GFKZ01006514.1~~GFKZ01006514.1.p1  ORF type:complete len:667 (-),score=86.14 GFKZ01006514.1:38-2038(-)